MLHYSVEPTKGWNLNSKQLWHAHIPHINPAVFYHNGIRQLFILHIFNLFQMVDWNQTFGLYNKSNDMFLSKIKQWAEKV